MDIKRKQIFITAIAGMLALILDAKTAFAGGQEGIMICIKSLIPTLFPFLYLSALTTQSFSGHYKCFNRLCNLMGVPNSSQSLLITGLLGGYPVGAQCIYTAYRDGRLSESQAHRLLGFCSNAGPAFILGMGSGLFSNRGIVFIIWAIHILSAFFVGMTFPGKEYSDVNELESTSISPVQTLQNSVKTMGLICGWVILFRVFYAIAEKWLFWILPQPLRVLLLGVFELSNGYIALKELQSESLRFILSSGMLGFGGICVYLQTVSVTKELGTGFYFPGKVLQTGISILLSVAAGFVLFPIKDMVSISPAAIIVGFSCIIAVFLVSFQKNKSSILFVNTV